MEPNTKGIRVKANSSSGLFRHADLDLSATWSTIDFDSLSAESKEALKTYRDTHVQIHPDDVAAFDAKIAAMSTPAAPTAPLELEDPGRTDPGKRRSPPR